MSIWAHAGGPISSLNKIEPLILRPRQAASPFRHRHLLGIEGLSPDDINQFLELADGYVELNRQADKKRGQLRGRTIINCFFERLTSGR